MQRIQMRSRNSRGLFVGGLVLGAIVAVAALIGGDTGMAVFGFMLLAVFGAFLGLSRSEFAVIGTADADERQREIDHEAVQIAYMAVVLVAVCGFLWELAHGNPGPFTFIAFVGGATHMGATAILKRRR